MLKQLNLIALFMLFSFLGFAQESTIYDFRDGDIITAGQSTDGKLTLNGNYGHHGGTYGLNMKVDSEIAIEVDGSCRVSFLGSVHSKLSMMGTAVTEGDLGTKDTKVDNDLSEYYEFTYEGDPAALVFKAVANAGNDIYLPLVEVTPIIVEDFPSNGKIDVWDFGAIELDNNIYNNHLSVAVLNALYDESITPGTNNIVFPNSWSIHRLSWKGGGNDRLRTTNTDITRFDQNVAASGYTGRVYVNSGAATGRYMSLVLNEDDIVTYIIKTDGGGNMVFENENFSELQKEEVAVTADLTELKFVAKDAGTYRIYDSQGKPSYYRIYREEAEYITLTGNIDISNADNIDATFEIEFENDNGKLWTTEVKNKEYSIKLPIGYTYEISLKDLNGYIISSGSSIEVDNSTTTHDIIIESVSLIELSGDINGIDAQIDNLEITFTPVDETNTFIPEIVIDKSAKTYSTFLEPNVEYSVIAKGVNDYEISESSINISADSQQDFTFTLKTLYDITIVADELTQAQKDELSLTFTNLYEEGYSYTFNDISDIKLRNGVYQLSYDGLDNYAIGLKLTSNLTVLDANTSKELQFEAITNWPFDDKVISSSTPSYKGLLFTGNIANQIDKGHLTAKENATIQIPVSVGQKVVFTYYYTADFSIEGEDPFITTSNSTGTLEYAEYLYTGETDGYVTATIGGSVGTTYIVNIATKNSITYQENLYVGVDKDYQTINDALDAIRDMVRENSERVVINVDPGNYEEMLIIDVANVTIRNSSENPSIALKDSGVNIDDDAVRITSYYGHGYNYYSMGNNQKWDGHLLNVNKDNGYLSYENKGAGTTNGSYWNATVVVTSSGFVAENLIFENSFNQYISQKESEDIVVPWESGSKGVRPTDVGNTSIQHKDFVERAAAFAIVNNVDKTIINNCRMVGHQDTFFGGVNSRVAVYKGAIMGGTDYIFGGMVATFYKSDLVLLTSDASSDVAYITAPQQSSGRGYLMYECNIVSAVPGVDNAAANSSKPGYFGRPWQGNTSEVVFYKTNIDASTHPNNLNKSLIIPAGWTSSLGGESPFMYEFGTIEASGEDNSSGRAAWSTILTEDKLSDGTEITLFNFTKGSDGWDPFEELIENDPSTNINKVEKDNFLNVYNVGSTVWVKNVTEQTNISVYNLSGMEVESFSTNEELSFQLPSGIWIVKISSSSAKATKIVIK